MGLNSASTALLDNRVLLYLEGATCNGKGIGPVFSHLELPGMLKFPYISNGRIKDQTSSEVY